jgi:prepilin-type N-terminal cleavage/methylation domain-containing protein
MPNFLSPVRAAAHTLGEDAFSLIELLVVLALVLILAALSASRFTTSARKRELAACANNLQKIYLALGFYRNDNGSYPLLAQAQTSAAPLSLLVPKGTTDTSIFICPGSGDKPLPQTEPFGQERISYDYYMGRASNSDPQDILLSDWQVDTLPKTKGRQIFSLDGKKPGNNHAAAGGNLLSCGGAVIFSMPKAAQDFVFPSTVRLLSP